MRVGMNQSTEAGKHDVCTVSDGFECQTAECVPYLMRVGVRDDFEEENKMGRTFFRRLIWCGYAVWSGKRNGVIRCTQDIVKSMTSKTTREIKREKEKIKERAAVLLSSQFVMNSYCGHLNYLPTCMLMLLKYTDDIFENPCR